MQTGEYEIRRLTTFRVEFDGRIAAAARTRRLRVKPMLLLNSYPPVQKDP